MPNSLELAVAGSGKTTSLVQHCADAPRDRKILVLTFTTANQSVLKERLRGVAGDHSHLEVMGWFTFLLRHFARPFIPFKFPGLRVRGFNFEGRPHFKASGAARFLDASGAVYACELGRLSSELVGLAGGALMNRLEALYDEILIDEVQDLSAHDWDILDHLFKSAIHIRMVGDVRQAVLATNPRSKKNSAYAYAGAMDWFQERVDAGTLEIEFQSTTWRCHGEIAKFADTIFAHLWDFPATETHNVKETGHDGLFLVHPDHIYEYVDTFGPHCLRHSVASGKEYNLRFTNFKISKGTEHERILIVPTAGIRQFLQHNKGLDAIPAACFYVAVTRAAQSVAIITDKSGNCTLPWWTPN